MGTKEITEDLINNTKINKDGIVVAPFLNKDTSLNDLYTFPPLTFISPLSDYCTNTYPPTEEYGVFIDPATIWEEYLDTVIALYLSLKKRGGWG
tara:strand:- start:211 stop:492 length:282 start_codon:yes stop_codon:yes gene_type:complete